MSVEAISAVVVLKVVPVVICCEPGSASAVCPVDLVVDESVATGLAVTYSVAPSETTSGTASDLLMLSVFPPPACTVSPVQVFAK